MMMLSGNVYALDAIALLEQCENGDLNAERGYEQSAGQGACLGFYAGVVHATTDLKFVWEAPALYCAPDNFSPPIGLKIWRKYIEDHPEKLTSKATSTIWLSLSEAYPCQD